MRAAKPSLLVLAAAIGLSAAHARARKTYTTPTSAEDFEKLLSPLTEQARAYAARPGDAAPPPSRVMTSVQYSIRSVGPLQKALKARHKDPLVEMYVARELLQPLHMAGDDLLRKLRPAMVDLLDRCLYQPMPKWPKAMLKTLKPPRQKAPRHVEQARRQRRDAALARKRAVEQAAVKHNRMANALEKTLKSLLVLMADEKADKAVLDRLRAEMGMKWTTYAHTLHAVRGQAVRMKKAQARQYYDTVLDIVRRHPRPREHADPTRPKYSDTANSSFESRRHDFPTEALKVVNLLATAAEEPAVIVTPDKKPRKPRDRRRRRR
jgi:hypothetical protein